MGGSEDKYENDPYIQQSQNNNALKNLYSNQSLNSHSFNDVNGPSVKDLSKQQETLNTKAFQNPMKVDKNSIRLERDAYNQEIFYITFDYTCDRTIYGNFYFNASYNPSNTEEVFIPSEAFYDKTIKIWFPPGKEQKFQDPNLKINAEYFVKNKVYSRKLIDLVMEFYVYDDTKQNVQCILAIFCGITFKPGTSDFNLKCLMQKVKVSGSDWYDVEEIYGLTTDENICEICCTNPRNTFFLPCKHSYTCQECSILIRAKDDKCPICRQNITDSVVLKNANENNNTS